MISINPIHVLLWTFRRNERDVINLYNSLSPLMQLATGGSMLNFGFWNQNTKDLAEAQRELCNKVGNLAELDSAKLLLDVGSGFSAPAMQWKSKYDTLEVTCVNINFHQLKNRITNNGNTISHQDGLSFVNATSIAMPLSNNYADRVIALESAQHFKPLVNFIRETRRIMKKDGIFVIAIPVTTGESLFSFLQLGILSLTWSSEHYDLDMVKSAIAREGFHISEIKKIGKNVYEPLANYYIKNRDSLRIQILKEYPSYLENILYKSLLKMKDASKKEIIDYALIKCILPKP